MHSYILMLQADEDDIDLTRSVLAGFTITVQMEYLHDIDRLDECLEAKGIPSLILVNDSHKRSSLGLLTSLAGEERLQGIPKIVLRESGLPAFVEGCYRRGAAGVITKPSTVDETENKIRKFFDYWLTVAELP
jgi:hypothetical protein